MRPIQLILVFIVATLLTGCGTLESSTHNSGANLQLTAPSHRLVYQRGLDGTALLPIAGTSAWSGGRVEARLVPIHSTNANPKWEFLGNVRADGDFS